MRRRPLLLIESLGRTPLSLLGEDGGSPIGQRSPLKMLRNIHTQAIRTHKSLNVPSKPKPKVSYPWEKHHPPGSETESGRVVTPGALKIVKDIEASMPGPRPPKRVDPHRAAEKAVAKTMRPAHDEIARRKRKDEADKRRKEKEDKAAERRKQGELARRKGELARTSQELY